jgi:hypothetical protein
MIKKFTLQWLLGTRSTIDGTKIYFKIHITNINWSYGSSNRHLTISVICFGKSIQHTTIAIELKGHEAAFNHPEFT